MSRKNSVPQDTQESTAPQEDGANDVQQSASQPDVPQPALIDVGKFTGIARFNGVEVQGFDRPWDYPLLKTPPKLDGFVWDEDLVLTLVIFWFSEDRHAMKLIGHTGAGKTEGVLQWHACLNLPLLVIGVNPRTEAQQLMGMPTTTVDGMAYVDGPLVTAARQGQAVLVDEYNLMDPGEASGLNAFLEGKPYTIPETGETIVPAPGFRIYATMNPKTSGYRGRNKQDMANDARFLDCEVKYLSKEAETPLVERALAKVYDAQGQVPDPAFLNKLATDFVSTANDIREQYMGVSDAGSALPCTMCTRTLLAWAQTAAMAKSLMPAGRSSIHWALTKVLSTRQDPEVREALHAIATSHMGERPDAASAAQAPSP